MGKHAEKLVVQEWIECGNGGIAMSLVVVGLHG